MLRVIEQHEEREPEPEGDSAQDWFERALELEATDPGAAIEAYARSVSEDSEFLAAWINWGRLLHERNETAKAEQIYREALEWCGPDAILLFNLGVLLEDQGKTEPALEAYQNAVGTDPDLADGHFNLARLYEALGKEQHAIRHLGQYRRLTMLENR
jgi:tetratricopeptide (TPR) repeat protein